MIAVPVLLLPNAFPYGVSRRPTGELRGGSPVGDVLCFAKSRANPPVVESGTARPALLSTGDVAGERFGKRVAAAEGDMSDVVDMDAALLVPWWVLSVSPAGFAGAGGTAAWVFGFAPIASYRSTMSEIELRRAVRRERGVSGGESACCANEAAASDEDANSPGVDLDAVTGEMNIDAGRERPVAVEEELSTDGEGEGGTGRRRLETLLDGCLACFVGDGS